MVQGDSRLMEILALKVLITDQSANRLAAEAMPRDLGLRDLRVRFAPEGAYVSGAYQMLVSVPFETLWELSVQGGRIAARLADVRVAKLGAGMLKGMILNALADAARRQQGLYFREDTLLIDLDHVLASRGMPSRTNLTLVQCQVGSLIIEAAAPPV